MLEQAAEDRDVSVDVAQQFDPRAADAGKGGIEKEHVREMAEGHLDDVETESAHSGKQVGHFATIGQSCEFVELDGYLRNALEELVIARAKETDLGSFDVNFEQVDSRQFEAIDETGKRKAFDLDDRR